MEESLKLIEQLADKLGTTVEKLWEVLVTQAPINSTITLVTNVVILATLFYSLRTLYIKSKDWDDEARWISIMLLGIVLAIWTLITIIDINGIITGFINPEYWALMKLRG